MSTHCNNSDTRWMYLKTTNTFLALYVCYFTYSWCTEWLLWFACPTLTVDAHVGVYSTSMKAHTSFLRQWKKCLFCWDKVNITEMSFCVYLLLSLLTSQTNCVCLCASVWHVCFWMWASVTCVKWQLPQPVCTALVISRCSSSSVSSQFHLCFSSVSLSSVPHFDTGTIARCTHRQPLFVTGF